MKSALFCFILLLSHFVLFGQANVSVKVLNFKTLDYDIFNTGWHYFRTNSPDEGLVEVVVSIHNESDKSIVFDLNQLELEGSGIRRSPGIYLLNSKVNVYKKNKVKIKKKETKERRLVYAFPEHIRPKCVTIFPYHFFPLPNPTIEPDTTYYTVNWQLTKNRSSAEFYRMTRPLAADKWEAKYYRIKNDILYQETQLSSVTPEVREGMSYTYHDDGKMESKIEYKGAFVTYHQFWDENGNPLIIDGEGVVKKERFNGNEHYKIFKNGNLTKNFEVRHDLRDTVYNFTGVQAEFPGGNSAFKKYVEKRLIYPHKAIKDDTEGRIFLEFVIDEDGKVDGVEVINGLGECCDQQVIEILEGMPAWRPAQILGKPVKAKYVTAVDFWM